MSFTILTYKLFITVLSYKNPKYPLPDLSIIPLRAALLPFFHDKTGQKIPKGGPKDILCVYLT